MATMGFTEDLAAAKTASRPTGDVDVIVNGKPYTLRFTQLPGIEWARTSVRFPARPGVLLDARYGYDLHSLIVAVSPTSGRLLDGDTEVELTVTDEVNEWDDLFNTLTGDEVEQIVDVVFSLNEWATAQAVAKAKKARSGSGKNSR